MAAGFSVTTGAAFAVTSGAKTILNLVAGATNPPILTEFSLSFDGVTASAVLVLVELCSSPQGPAGTRGTSGPGNQGRGYPSFTPVTAPVGKYYAGPTTLTGGVG